MRGIQQYRGRFFRLRDLKNGLYQVHVENGPAYEGTETYISVIAEEMGLFRADIEIAKDEMRKHNHDYAEFGIFGRFLYTRKDAKKAA